MPREHTAKILWFSTILPSPLEVINSNLQWTNLYKLNGYFLSGLKHLREGGSVYRGEKQKQTDTAHHKNSHLSFINMLSEQIQRGCFFSYNDCKHVKQSSVVSAAKHLNLQKLNEYTIKCVTKN